MHAPTPPTILFLFPFLTTGYLKNQTTAASIFVTNFHQTVYKQPPASKILFFAMTPSLFGKGYENLMLSPIRCGDRSSRSHSLHHQAIQGPGPRPDTYLETQALIQQLLKDTTPEFARSICQGGFSQFSVTNAQRTGQIVRLSLILVAIYLGAVCQPPNCGQSNAKSHSAHPVTDNDAEPYLSWSSQFMESLGQIGQAV